MIYVREDHSFKYFIGPTETYNFGVYLHAVAVSFFNNWHSCVFNYCVNSVDSRDKRLN